MVNKNTKVAVLGAGAMGCLFGGLLAEKGLNVILIDVWKQHVDEINKKGLKMMGHGGDRTIKIRATTEPGKLDTVDAIIVMCKATALEQALESSKKIIGEKTFYYESTKSTNCDIWELFKKERKEGIAVIANEQFEGRGRNEKVWYSKKDKSIICSFLIKQKFSTEKIVLVK